MTMLLEAPSNTRCPGQHDPMAALRAQLLIAEGAILLADDTDGLVYVEGFPRILLCDDVADSVTDVATEPPQRTKHQEMQLSPAARWTRPQIVAFAILVAVLVFFISGGMVAFGAWYVGSSLLGFNGPLLLLFSVGMFTLAAETVLGMAWVSSTWSLSGSDGVD